MRERELTFVVVIVKEGRKFEVGLIQILGAAIAEANLEGD